MLYQLPNGKVVQMTVEEYLALTDLDISYLLSIDCGEYALDPFSGSVIVNQPKHTDEEEEEEEIEESETYYDEFFPDKDDFPDEPLELDIE